LTVDNLRTEFGATPAASVNATISISIKNDGADSPFLRVGKGLYGLRESRSSSSSSSSTSSVDEEAETAGEEAGLINAFGMYWARDKVLWTPSPRILGRQQPGSKTVDFASQKGVYLLHDGRDVVYVGRTTDQRSTPARSSNPARTRTACAIWTARLLGKLLGYSEYRNFLPVIEKAREACRNSGHDPADHFEDLLEMVPIGSGATRRVPSVALSRYACYLIVQNADPAKPIVAEGQTYFAIQTRRQELADQGRDFDKLGEDEKHLLLREELKKHNRQLVDAAKGAGVETTIDYAIFQNHVYRGLYGGLDARGIHRRKGLKKSQKILDHMGSTELAANLFRATSVPIIVGHEVESKSEGVEGFGDVWIKGG